MKKVTTLLYSSWKELFNVKTLCVSAMLLAMVLVLKVVSINSDLVRAGLSAVPSSMAFQLLGPVSGGIFGAASDLIYTMIGGYAPNLGITFTAIVSGVIFGAITYQKPVSLVRIIIARVLIAVICSMFLNTYFLAQMRGIEFWPLFVTRVWKNVIEVPVTVVLYYAVAKAMERFGVFRMLKPSKIR